MGTVVNGLFVFEILSLYAVVSLFTTVPAMSRPAGTFRVLIEVLIPCILHNQLSSRRNRFLTVVISNFPSFGLLCPSPRASALRNSRKIALGNSKKNDGTCFSCAFPPISSWNRLATGHLL